MKQECFFYRKNALSFWLVLIKEIVPPSYVSSCLRVLLHDVPLVIVTLWYIPCPMKASYYKLDSWTKIVLFILCCCYHLRMCTQGGQFIGSTQNGQLEVPFYCQGSVSVGSVYGILCDVWDSHVLLKNPNWSYQ